FSVGGGWVPPASWNVLFLVTALTFMGFGKGVVFQVVSDRFPKQIGLASGVIGAAGGLGGFFLPLWLGGLKDLTGTYATGLWLFAAVAAGAAVSTIITRRRKSVNAAATSGADRFAP